MPPEEPQSEPDKEVTKNFNELKTHMAAYIQSHLFKKWNEAHRTYLLRVLQFLIEVTAPGRNLFEEDEHVLQISDFLETYLESVRNHRFKGIPNSEALLEAVGNLEMHVPVNSKQVERLNYQFTKKPAFIEQQVGTSIAF